MQARYSQALYQREGLKRSGPNGVIYSCGSACVGVARNGNLDSLNGREFFFVFVFVFVCRWVLVVLWSREVGISGHGAHGSMQDDELYILALRSWV